MADYDRSYAPFVPIYKVASDAVPVNYAVNDQEVILPHAAHARTRHGRTIGSRCAYCAPGSTCTSCKRYQDLSKFGTRTLASANASEARRVYNTMIEDATTRPSFGY